MVVFYSSFGLLVVCFCLLDTTHFQGGFVEGKIAVFGEDSRLGTNKATSGMTEGHKNVPLYEGDIVLTEQQKKEMANERVRRDITNQRVRRKITTDLSKRWKLPINYTFDGTHDYSERQLIRSAVFHWSSQTCIRLREISLSVVGNETIVFTKGSGCWSSVGFDSDQKRQKISIGPGCLWMGTIAHELGHTLGFWHEQARPDRDDYVTVLTNNVMIDRDFNFQKSTWGEVMSYGVAYDVGSLMHYGSKFFSENGKRTIQTNDPRLQKVIGQRDGLSFADVKTANLAYCSEICQNQIERDFPLCKNDGYPDPLNCSRCRCPDGLGGRTCETVAKSSQGCGGVLRAAHRDAYIQSPGYPNDYSAHVQCHWLIQAPPGYRIFFEFVGEFSLTEDEDADACVDFLEVRYYDNLSFTGGRFCGHRRPADTMISQNSQLLLLFRAAEDGKVGFRARYHTEACGGCLSSAAPREKACVRTVTYPCLREWRIRTRAPCITWWSWTITDCGYTYKTVTREDTCSRTERYCCKAFRLDGDVCRSITYEANKFPPYKGGESEKVGNETRVIPVGWSTWSGWSDCTKPCGGCGRRVRTRKCSDPVFCGGLEQQEQSEACNDAVCPPSMVEFCPLRYAVKTVCNPWTMETCIQYKTKLTTCHLACCKGYVQHEQRCIKTR